MTVLDQACQHFKVRVVAEEPTSDRGGAFLGAGTSGFVFRVKRLDDEHNKGLALKICVSGFTGDSNNVRRLDSEHRKMLQAYEKCPNVVMKIEEDGFKHLFDKNQEEVGAAMLLSHVGRDCSSLSPCKIFLECKSLRESTLMMRLQAI